MSGNLVQVSCKRRTQRHREDGHVTAGSEMRVMQLRAMDTKGCHPPPEARTQARNGSSTRNQPQGPLEFRLLAS